MKHILPLLALVALAPALLAQSDADREFKQLTDQRDRAIAAVDEPINRRYAADLEALLRRATLANDLTTALKIKQTLARLGVGGPGTPATAVDSPVGTWIFKMRGESYPRTFRADGTIIGSGFKGTGTWTIAKGKVVITYPDKGEGYLDMPLNPKGTKGRTHGGDEIVAVRETQ
jgi:hypothetical protein